MELKLHPLRSFALNIKSAYDSTNVYINQSAQNDGIIINLMGAKKYAKNFNKIRIVEDEFGLINAHVYAKDAIIPELKENEKVIWSNF